MLTHSGTFEVAFKSSFIKTTEVSPRQAATARNCELDSKDICSSNKRKSQKRTYNEPWQHFMEVTTNC